MTRPLVPRGRVHDGRVLHLMAGDGLTMCGLPGAKATWVKALPLCLNCIRAARARLEKEPWTTTPKSSG